MQPDAGRAFRMTHPSWRALSLSWRAQSEFVRAHAPKELFVAGVSTREDRKAAEIAERLLGDLCALACFSDQFAGRQ